MPWHRFDGLRDADLNDDKCLRAEGCPTSPRAPGLNVGKFGKSHVALRGQGGPSNSCSRRTRHHRFLR
ncbi:hypothetical protein DESC_800034 [Desulfosarcina cetonica]|nr:hypothetical protein DESC_800034 [Desulfosarcina cetonica]